MKCLRMSNPSQDSFNEIYLSYYKKSFLFAKSYVHDELVAEDIASEALIALWEKLKQGEIMYIEPLLLTILKNKALDYLKHQEVQRRALEKMADWEQKELALRISTLTSCDPDEIFSEEIHRIVNVTLQALSEQARQAFVLSRYEDKSNKEIADLLGISVKGVEYHISKALKALRISLRDYLPIFYLLFV